MFINIHYTCRTCATTTTTTTTGVVKPGVNRSLPALTAVPPLAWGSRDVGGTAAAALARASLIVNKPADDPRPSIRLTNSVASRRVSNSQTPNMVE